MSGTRRENVAALPSAEGSVATARVLSYRVSPAGPVTARSAPVHRRHLITVRATAGAGAGRADRAGFRYDGGVPYVDPAPAFHPSADRNVIEILEPYGPLSRSTIWQRLADCYTAAGSTVWEDIPTTVTGNPFVGHLFAVALEAWLQDQGDAVDPNEPLYVFEPGAGTGLFSHAFLNALARRRAQGLFPHPRVILLMCDQSDAQLDEWAATPPLAAHADAGALDFATLAVDERGGFGPIVPRRDGRALAALKNPVVVVANYFFDSIPCDAFRVRGGEVFEARTRFVRTGDAPGFEDYENEEVVVAAGPRPYGDPVLDGILAGYARDCAQASLTLPVAGIRCLEALAGLAGGRMLLLSIDKGITTPGRLEGWFKQPFVAHDGVFSYAVNYDALRRHFEAKGGTAHCSNMDDRSLVCFVATVPGAAAPGGHLRRFFVDQIDAVDALNGYVSFTQGLDALPTLTKGSSVKLLFDALARLQADPDAFAAIVHMSLDLLPRAKEELRSVALRVARRAKENFHSARFHNDVFYWSGRVHNAFGQADSARRDFEASVAHFGDASQAHFFLGAFAEHRGDLDGAARHYALYAQLMSECPLTRAALQRVAGTHAGSAVQAR
jgi:hypothetical protein